MLRKVDECHDGIFQQNAEVRSGEASACQVLDSTFHAEPGQSSAVESGATGFEPATSNRACAGAGPYYDHRKT